MKEFYYGFIYLWENTHPDAQNHTKYIGQHKGNIDDGYTGSGKIFKVKFLCEKYQGYWKRHILQLCYSWEELNKAEAYWVDHYNAIDSDEFCNCRGGGINGRYSKERSERKAAITKLRYQKELDILIKELDRKNFLRSSEILQLVNMKAPRVIKRCIESLIHQKIAKRRGNGTSHGVLLHKYDFCLEQTIIDYIKLHDGCTYIEIKNFIRDQYDIHKNITLKTLIDLTNKKVLFRHKCWRVGYRYTTKSDNPTLIQELSTLRKLKNQQSIGERRKPYILWKRKEKHLAGLEANS